MDIFIGNLVMVLGTRYRDEIDDINMIGKKNFGVHTNGAQMFSGSIRYFCARLLVSEPVLIWFRGRARRSCPKFEHCPRIPRRPDLSLPSHLPFHAFAWVQLKKLQPRSYSFKKVNHEEHHRLWYSTLVIRFTS